MRNALLACTAFDWSRISPAIFGSLFQAVMEPKQRRQIGGHYTSERDILKVIRSLFLDDLHAEFEQIKADRSTRRRARWEEFHAKLCRLRFLDPACGCGNFLVITYRELRQIELEVLQELFGGQRELTLDEVNRLSQVDVDQFYGIEISAQEYLHGERRWCLWLKGVPPETVRTLEKIYSRVEAVRDYRLASQRPATKMLADYPMLFGEIRQPSTNYVLIPRHSSELRRYIPLSYFNPNYIVSDSCLFLPDAALFHFGVLSSAMHMAWVRQVCGRLKSDYRYSAKLVYNNYPWPETTDKQRAAVEKAAQAVLEVRQQFPNATLADLYDPLSMPPALVKAHTALDRAVDKGYRPEPFTSERQRIEHLFALYGNGVSPRNGVSPMI